MAAQCKHQGYRIVTRDVQTTVGPVPVSELICAACGVQSESQGWRRNNYSLEIAKGMEAALAEESRAG